MPAYHAMELDRERMREACANDLFFFASWCLGYDKLVKRVHGPICEALEDLALTRVNVTMPRKFYKSTLCSIAYPIWRIIRDANHTMLLVMNTVDNAKLKLAELKGHFERGERFRNLFPEVIPNFGKSWSAESCIVKRSSVRGAPTFQIAGATTTVISRAVDEIVMDDLLTAKQDDAAGDEILPTLRDIDRSIVWYKGALSLLNDPVKGRLLNVGTRWARKDLVEYVLRTSEHFRRNNFELRAVEGEWGARDCRATMPENYPMSALKEIADTQGSTIFRLWYLNEPIDPAELVFDLDPEENFYRVVDMGGEWVDGLRKYTAVDLAFSSKEKADNTAIVTIGVDEQNVRYVLDVQYGHFAPMQVVDLLFAVYERFHPRVMGIESVAAQAMLPRMLPYHMKERGQALPIKEIKRGGKASKEYRITTAVQPWVQNKMLKLPVGNAKALEVEMRDFRVDEKRRGHDDALDALADCIQMSVAQQAYIEPVVKRRTDEDWAAIRRGYYDMDAAVQQLIVGDKPQMNFNEQLKHVRFAYLAGKN